jgi:uncharacterized Tic20 family protein
MCSNIKKRRGLLLYRKVLATQKKVSMLSESDYRHAAVLYWASILFGLLAGLISLVGWPQSSSMVKRHAVTTIALSLLVFVFQVLLYAIAAIFVSIPFLGHVLYGFTLLAWVLLSLASLAAQLFIGLRLYQGQDTDIPILTAVLLQQGLVLKP